MSGEVILRLNAVMKKTGLGASMIYLLMAEGKFPKSIKITKRTVGWLLSEVEAFIEGRIAESRADLKDRER
jgi:prophage regulatory protein